jgi:hypothetical protein
LLAHQHGSLVSRQNFRKHCAIAAETAVLGIITYTRVIRQNRRSLLPWHILTQNKQI